MRSKDLHLLDKWLKNPHVKEVWANENFEESYEKYLFRINDPAVEQFIITTNDRPIGYFQYYWASKVGDGWWEGIDDFTVGIDFYIGEVQFLGKGLGLEIVLASIDLLFSNLKVQRIIADPSPSNSRILKILEEAQFTKKNLIQTPDGEALLMELSKSEVP